MFFSFGHPTISKKVLKILSANIFNNNSLHKKKKKKRRPKANWKELPKPTIEKKSFKDLTHQESNQYKQKEEEEEARRRASIEDQKLLDNNFSSFLFIEYYFVNLLVVF